MILKKIKKIIVSQSLIKKYLEINEIKPTQSIKNLLLDHYKNHTH